MKIIIGILAVLITFTVYCCCRVAGKADEELEDAFSRSDEWNK